MAFDTRNKTIYKVTLAGTAVNILLTILKFAAGVVGRSSAMIADAVHSLSDLISDAIVLIFVKLAGRPEDSDHSFGHGKYETLATLAIGLILALVGAGILADSVEKSILYFQGGKLEVPNWWALGAAIVSIVSKEWLFHFTVAAAKKIDSQVLEANAWHHRSDSLTSIATLVGIGGVILLGDKWTILDPLAAAFVSVFIIYSAWGLIKPAIDELLEKSLNPKEIEKIKELIASTGGIMDYHHLRTRKIGNAAAISLHIKMDGRISLSEAHNIATVLERKLKEEFNNHAIVTIHMEPVNFDRQNTIL